MQKYKVFWNDKRIVFATPGKITLTKTSIQIPWDSIASDVISWLNHLAQLPEKEAVVEHQVPEEAFQAFRSALLQLNAAGGVVKRKDQLLFIFRNGKWDLPKGKMDEGESKEEAALREVQEECGIVGHSVLKSLPSTCHIYRSPYRNSTGKLIFKETFWFEMYYGGEENGSPQAEEGITGIRWFLPSELDEVLANTYGNLEELIRRYLPKEG